MKITTKMPCHDILPNNPFFTPTTITNSISSSCCWLDTIPLLVSRQRKKSGSKIPQHRRRRTLSLQQVLLAAGIL
jgi:hypothetical protein